jgi:hypothetical protein
VSINAGGGRNPSLPTLVQRVATIEDGVRVRDAFLAQNGLVARKRHGKPDLRKINGQFKYDTPGSSTTIAAQPARVALNPELTFRQRVEKRVEALIDDGDMVEYKPSARQDYLEKGRGQLDLYRYEADVFGEPAGRDILALPEAPEQGLTEWLTARGVVVWVEGVNF